jgi:hypothetical protein
MMKFGTPAISASSDGNCAAHAASTSPERLLRRLRFSNPLDDETRVGEGVSNCRQRPSPEPLRHLYIGLAPGVGYQLGVEVPAFLAWQARPERMIERDNGPPAGPQRGRE